MPKNPEPKVPDVAESENTPAVDPLSPAVISSPKAHPKPPPNIPKAKAIEAAKIRYLGQPPELSEYKGSYVQRKDGQPFALAVLKSDEVENNKTHFARNSVYMWNGTEEEFRDQFDKA